MNENRTSNIDASYLILAYIEVYGIEKLVDINEFRYVKQERH